MEAVDPDNKARDPAPIEKPKKNIGRSVLALALAIGISISVFVIGNRVSPEQFERYGYVGVFVISVLGNATIIFPAPSLAVVSMTGAFLNPFLVGLVAGVGEPLGELTGYLAGYSGKAMVEDRENYEKVVSWSNKYGLWVIFVLSMIPNPLFDLAGIAAGTLQVPVYKFLIACWAGKTIKTTLFALGGRAILLPFMD
ncbi:MAG: VTT domain-containing protein [Anaerolineae bacterium]|nr:VTT domain-containing protein [Anaerolineae bacterium]